MKVFPFSAATGLCNSMGRSLGVQLPDFTEYDSPFSHHHRRTRKESKCLLTSQNAKKQMVIASSATSKDDERSNSK